MERSDSSDELVDCRMHRKVFHQIRDRSDRVSIEKIQFYAYHGHRSEEHVLGQRFECSIHAYLDLSRPGHSDQLEHTLDYCELHQVVTAWVTTHRFHLLEALAEGLAAEIFGSFPLVDALTLCVRKLNPPIPHYFGHVEVEVTRVNPRHLAEPK